MIKTKVRLTILLLTSSLFLISTGCSSRLTEKSMPPPSNQESNTVVASQPPQFIGGVDQLLEYVSQNLHYPGRIEAAGIFGQVVVNFEVQEDGSIANVTIRESHIGVKEKEAAEYEKKGNPKMTKEIGTKLLEAEAIKVVENMPKWKPGTEDGMPTSGFFNLPINFRGY